MNHLHTTGGRINIILLFLSLLAAVSCSNVKQDAIVGLWKPAKVSFVNQMHEKVLVVYETGKNGSIKQTLLKRYVHEENADLDLIKFDTVSLKKELETKYAGYDSAKLSFGKDSAFLMESYGLLIPDAEAGWHFSGNSMKGKWALNNKKGLTLIIGDEKEHHSFFYKVIELSDNRLILGQIHPENGNIEKVDPFLQLEFVRQK